MLGKVIAIAHDGYMLSINVNNNSLNHLRKNIFDWLLNKINWNNNNSIGYNNKTKLMIGCININDMNFIKKLLNEININILNVNIIFLTFNDILNNNDNFNNVHLLLWFQNSIEDIYENNNNNNIILQNLLEYVSKGGIIIIFLLIVINVEIIISNAYLKLLLNYNL